MLYNFNLQVHSTTGFDASCPAALPVALNDVYVAHAEEKPLRRKYNRLKGLPLAIPQAIIRG